MKIFTKCGAKNLNAARLLINTLTVLTLVVLMLAPGIARAADNSARHAVIQRVRAWDRAAAERDTKALDRILADGLIITLANGQVENKRGYLLRFVKAPQMTLNVSHKSTDIEVKLYGDTAIVTGKSPAKQPYRGPKTIGQYRFTDVYIKHNGNWQAIVSQLTRVEPQKKKSVPPH